MKRYVEVGIYVVLAALVAFLFDIITYEQFLTAAGLFGFSSVQALRELFLVHSRATRVVTIVGVVFCAVWGFGNLQGYAFASAEEFQFLLFVVFGAQIVSFTRGLVRSGFRLKQGVTETL